MAAEEQRFLSRRIPEESHRSGEVPLISPRVIAIIGPELSGKSQQGKIISERTNLPLVKVGEMFRTVQKEDSALGEETRALQEAGGYADADLFRKVLRWGIGENEEYRNGFIIEGAPRTLDQFKLFSEIVHETTGQELPIQIVFLNITRKHAYRRLSQRPPRIDDAQLDTRLDEHYKDLAEKVLESRKFSEKFVVISTVRRDQTGEVIGDKTFREVSDEILDKLGIDKTQIRTYDEFLLTNQLREVLDLQDYDLAKIGHDIATLPRKDRPAAIIAYLKNIKDMFLNGNYSEIRVLEAYLEKLYAESI